MTKEWIASFFELLLKKMEEITEDNVLCSDFNEADWVLNSALAILENSDYVILHTVPLSVREDVLMLIIYIELKNEFKEEIITELEKAINFLNNIILVGTLGIYKEKQEMFYKYCFKIDCKKSLEENIMDTITIYELMMGEVEYVYPVLKSIWQGDANFKQTDFIPVDNKS